VGVGEVDACGAELEEGGRVGGVDRVAAKAVGDEDDDVVGLLLSFQGEESEREQGEGEELRRAHTEILGEVMYSRREWVGAAREWAVAVDLSFREKQKNNLAGLSFAGDGYCLFELVP
jgi:hypothetical protein